MKLTQEQREQIDAARAAGKTSIVTAATPEQLAEWRAAAAAR